MTHSRFMKRARLLWDAMGYLYAQYGNPSEIVKTTGQYFPDQADEQACEILAGCRDLLFTEYLGGA